MIGLRTPVTVTNEYKWYEYHQNNSGGSFQIDDSVSVYVLIQATSAKEANNIAEDIGIYFDGISKGYDCDCCGDRWSEPWDELEEFSVYSWTGKGGSRKIYDNVLDYAQALADGDMWAKEGKPSVIVYFINGVKQAFYKQ